MMRKICKDSTNPSVPYAIVTSDLKVWISNPKDQLYSQLVEFIKLTVEVIKKGFKIFMVLVFRRKKIN